MGKVLKKMWKFIFYIILILIMVLWIGFLLITQPIIWTTDISKILLDTSINLQKIPKAHEEILKKHVKKISSHNRFSENGLKKTGLYIVKELWKIDFWEKEIEIQKYSIWKKEYFNIIVHLKDTSNIKRKWVYVIGAHYDSHKKLPWADDNASGVAWLLEIARILNNHKYRDKNIDLVFYSTEELPHFNTNNMGSYKHAKDTKNIKLAIILEMIWYFSETEWSQNYPIDSMKYLYWNTGNFITLVSNLKNISPMRDVKAIASSYAEKNNFIEIKSINAPEKLPWIWFSDHKNYWKFNIPAIMVTDTAFYRNKNYHTKNDTYEKLDYKKMSEVVDTVVFTVLAL